MPAKYAEMGSFGFGIRFPNKGGLDNKTKRALYKLGLKKCPWTITDPQTWTVRKEETTIQQVVEFIQAYNKEYYEI